MGNQINSYKIRIYEDISICYRTARNTDVSTIVEELLNTREPNKVKRIVIEREEKCLN